MCSAGPVNTPQLFTDPDVLRSTCGYGPGVETAAIHLAEDGAVYFTRVTSDVAGVAGSVTQTGTGPTVTATGAPNDSHRIRGTITTGGAVGTSAFVLSTDGGNTYGAPIATAATYLVPNTNVTLAFAVGTYVAGDTFSLDCQEPYFSTTNLNTAGAAIIADNREWGILHVAGVPQGADAAAKATACNAIASAVDAIMVARVARYFYARAFVDAPDVAAGALATAFANFVSSLVLVGAGFHDVQSPLTKLIMKRPIGATYCGRVATLPIHTHPGEVAQGALNTRVKALYLTEAEVTTLDAARFVTLRVLPGAQGFWITRGNTMAATGSDYASHQNCRVIDRASKVGRNAELRWLNKDLDLNADGTLQEVQAKVIDDDLVKDLRAAMSGHVSGGISATASRTVNVQSTRSLGGKFRMIPKGYAEAISFELGFTPTA